jgi:hypothetical protein
MTTIDAQYIDTAILKSLLDELVAVGVISELSRLKVYSDAAEAIQRIPGDHFDIVSDLLLLADGLHDENGELKASRQLS